MKILLTLALAFGAALLLLGAAWVMFFAVEFFPSA